MVGATLRQHVGWLWKVIYVNVFGTEFSFDNGAA